MRVVERVSIRFGGERVGKAIQIRVWERVEEHGQVGHGRMDGRERRSRHGHGSVVVERGLMVTWALFWVVCLCGRVVWVLTRLVAEMLLVVRERVLSQLMALKGLGYQTVPLVVRELARVMRRSYGSVALVARGKDAVALR